MSQQWMTVAEAAIALKVHPRTIERRMASGKVQTRRDEQGIVQVLIDAPDPMGASDPLETVRELAQDQVSLATGSASAIVRLAQADAERARNELELVRQHVGRARQQVTLAWSTVGVLGIVSIIAVGWASHRITDASGKIRSMQSELQRVSQDGEKIANERDRLREELVQAKLAGAEAAGQLSAWREQHALSGARPTTQPSNLVQRIAGAVWGD
jgi:hypothetical protein